MKQTKSFLYFRPPFFPLLPGSLASSPIPEMFSAEPHWFPVRGDLASDLQARSRPRSPQPQGLFLLIVLGETMGLAPPPHALSREPSPRVGGHLASLPDLLMGRLPPPCSCLPPHPSMPPSARGNSESHRLAASWTSLVPSSRWSGFTFRNGSASNSPFTVHVFILRLCPIQKKRKELQPNPFHVFSLCI